MGELEQRAARAAAASDRSLRTATSAEPTSSRSRIGEPQTIVAARADPALDSNPHLQAWRAPPRRPARRATRSRKPLRACGRLTRAAGLVLEAVGLRLGGGLRSA